MKTLIWALRISALVAVIGSAFFVPSLFQWFSGLVCGFALTVIGWDIHRDYSRPKRNRQ